MQLHPVLFSSFLLPLLMSGAAAAGEPHVSLLIGQSNMAGRADLEERDEGPIERALLLNAEGE